MKVLCKTETNNDFSSSVQQTHKFVYVEKLNPDHVNDPPRWKQHLAFRGKQPEGRGQCYESNLAYMCFIVRINLYNYTVDSKQTPMIPGHRETASILIENFETS